MPPLLSSRPDHLQAVLTMVVPIAFGLAVGWVLGVSEGIYLLLSLLAVLGGLLAGLEHEGARAGALRGLVAGLLFGTFILVGHEISGLDPKAHLPEKEGTLVPLIGAISAVLGAVGGFVRGRYERRHAAPPRAAQVQ